MGAHRGLAALATAALAGALLSGCDAGGGPSGPDTSGPERLATALATALQSGDAGDFGGVELTAGDASTVADDYSRIVDGMDGLTPTVGSGGVHVSGASATAALRWTWPVAGDEWSYTTQARLSRRDGRWEVAWDPAVVEPSLTPGETLDLTTRGADRAPVIGAGGTRLVTERPVIRLGVDRGKVPARQAGRSARRLAAMVGIDPGPYAKRVEAAGDKAFVEAIVYRQEQLTRSVADFQAIPGVVAVTATLPLAPTKEFAAPILGSVGEVTAEMIEKDPERYHLGDQAGLSGLQARYDDQLRGTPGATVDAVAQDGSTDQLFEVRPQPGTPLRLTLDADLELAAERLLSGVGPASALVALRPSTGDILVAANGPGNDGYNIATYGQLAPGSTFKSVSSLALLRAGLTPESVVPCSASLVVDGKTFTNYSDYPTGALGRIPLRTALANSCNTAFISQAGKVGDTGLVDAAASLGLGVDHDLGFPAYFGNVQPPASATEAAADMIGQGKVLASPMVMAAVMGSVQAGHVVVPRLVRSVEVQAPDADPLTAGEASDLRTMLRGVVTSGSGRGLADVPGPPVLAKTGTAEFERDGKVLTHAWMVAAQGDLAVAVFVDVGESGSGTAGPILEAFLRAAHR